MPGVDTALGPRQPVAASGVAQAIAAAVRPVDALQQRHAPEQLEPVPGDVRRQLQARSQGRHVEGLLQGTEQVQFQGQGQGVGLDRSAGQLPIGLQRVAVVEINNVHGLDPLIYKSNVRRIPNSRGGL